MFSRVFGIFIFLLTINLYANTATSLPTIFIGTYNTDNSDTLKNLVIPNTPSGVNEKHWNLTSYTQYLLKQFNDEFKNQVAKDKFNLISMKDFSENLDKFANSSTDIDKKIGFFHVDTYQTVDINQVGEELITVTISLIFAEIGEEANRVNDHNNFEVRYTNGITVSGVLELEANDKQRESKIQDAYRNFYIRAIYDLIGRITKDQSSKKVKSVISDDIYFSIGSIHVNKKAKVLLKKVYGTQEQADKQILMILQEELIKKIRQNKKLDDVVLLYPKKLNDIIVNNWSVYLSRINQITKDGNTNDDTDVLIRTIVPSCEDMSSNSEREIPLDGYLIEIYLSELYDNVTEKEDIESVHAIKASIVSRIIIHLKKKTKIDALSTPTKIIKKKKVCVGQAGKGYIIENSLSSVRKSKLAKTIRKSIENLSPKLVKMIEDVVKNRGYGFDYKDFCKE